MHDRRLLRVDRVPMKFQELPFSFAESSYIHELLGIDAYLCK
jgi:hypothetical protein